MNEENQKIEELIAVYRRLSEKLEEVRVQEAAVAKRYKQHELASQYESYAEYLAAAQALKAIEDEAREIADDHRMLERARKDAELSLLKRLPRQVWIRFGDIGVGVAYTDWGGSRDYIQIEPWQAEMPSLDHTYRGD